MTESRADLAEWHKRQNQQRDLVANVNRSFRRPAHLPLAVTLSIYGHHFRQTCRVPGL